jgi:hypothetical protein
MNTKLNRATWFYTAGKEYFDAFHILILQFQVLTQGWINQIQRPTYYCGGFAAESFLKSYLTHKGVAFPDKSHKGHDLKNLISIDKNGVKTFFGLEDVDLEQIYILNDRYCEHEVYGKDDLRYGDKPGLRKSPHPDNLDRILRIMERKLQSALMLEWAKERDHS